MKTVRQRAAAGTAGPHGSRRSAGRPTHRLATVERLDESRTPAIASKHRLVAIEPLDESGRIAAAVPRGGEGMSR
jgi:hypothetical protein